MVLPFNSLFSETEVMPPKLVESFLKSLYKGKKTELLYENMSTTYKGKTSFSQFKEQIKPYHLAKWNSKLRLKKLSQVTLSPTYGVLYFISHIQKAKITRNNFFLIEKIRVVREPQGWRLNTLPTPLTTAERSSNLTKKDLQKILYMVREDRQQEILRRSKKSSVARSLDEAYFLLQSKKYRQALISYEKVLQLDQNNNTAKQGVAFCEEQLSHE